MWQEIFFLIFSYAIGSIPFSYILGLKFGNRDIRFYYDGNVGAHNVARVAGLKWGIIASLLDAFKGFIVGLISLAVYGEDSTMVWLMGLLVLVGHNFPFTLKFRGGKGISTFYGFLFALHPQIATLSIIIFGFSYLLRRNFDLALTLGMIFIPAGLFFSRVKEKEFLKIISLMVLIGLKKLIDLPYEREIKRRFENEQKSGNTISR